MLVDMDSHMLQAFVRGRRDAAGGAKQTTVNSGKEGTDGRT